MADEETNYKLIYFNARGRAEHIRYILAYAGLNYTDERIPKERWPELKKSMPFGQLPVLEINGQVIAQSNAIARYLARKHGLTGSDEWEAMLCDALVDSLGDLKLELLQFQKEDDLFKKEEKKAKFVKETIPFFLNKFEKTIGSNGGFAVGSSMFGATALEKYPALRGLKQRVHALPAIAEWIAKRPHTSF
ncbi:unnamed protein product [Trichogramma brassicae]|uniref:glutathione transferase n=1 Tax=Trichogramma brassicae TaxID=86971 RepID=A0A6H5IRM5_9HYME|nr:unnamed protein product [Trichogramma brassicae]